MPQLVMFASRQKACRTVNYHMYEIEGGVVAKKLSKDSDCYRGKLR